MILWILKKKRKIYLLTVLFSYYNLGFVVKINNGKIFQKIFICLWPDQLTKGKDLFIQNVDHIPQTPLFWQQSVL